MTDIASGLEPSSAHLRAIDRSRLDAQRSPHARAWPVEVVERTGSTNADLLEALRAEPALPVFGEGDTGLAAARVRVAYEQTAGRGRRGRAWIAQPGEALLFSVGGWLPRGIDGLAGLSLAVGLAVHDALRALPVEAQRVALKWPNDVLVDGAKVSGILIETAKSTREATAIVVGIGINLRGAASLVREIEQIRGAGAAPPTPPTALDAIWAEPSMTDLLGHLLNALAATFETFGAHGFAPLQAAWCAADSYRDRAVALYEGADTPTSGVGRGVDASGHLLIETATGLRTIASGDVSLRAA